MTEVPYKERLVLAVCAEAKRTNRPIPSSIVAEILTTPPESIGDVVLGERTLYIVYDLDEHTPARATSVMFQDQLSAHEATDAMELIFSTLEVDPYLAFMGVHHPMDNSVTWVLSPVSYTRDMAPIVLNIFQ